MNKKYLHHIWTKIRPVKVWHLLLLLGVSATMSVFALRQNNLTMVQLREVVYQADKNNDDVEGALQNLRGHVHAHMNTSLTGGDNAVYPPIQLKYTYQRLKEAEKVRVQQNSSQIYTDAQTHCEDLNASDFSGRNRIPCIEKYVAEHGAKERSIPDALYKFDFVSPRWSFDLAGISLALSIVVLLLLVLRIVVGRIMKRIS